MKKEPSISIFITIIIMGFVLVLVTGLNALSLRGVAITQSLGDSVSALRAADTGIERWLSAYFNDPGTALECADSQESPPCKSNYPDGTEPGFTNEQSYEIFIRSASNPVIIRSIGKYRNSQRGLEISF